MERLPAIPYDKMTDSQKRGADEFKRIRNGAEIFGPFQPLNRSPELMTLVASLGTYCRYKTVLGPQLNEFVVITAARFWSSSYEWSIHAPIALKEGVKPETVAAIQEGRRPQNMLTEQEIAYDFVDELLKFHGVSDGTYARAVQQFGEQGVVDIIGVAGFYSLIAMVLNVARTPPDTPDAPTLKPLVP